MKTIQELFPAIESRHDPVDSGLILLYNSNFINKLIGANYGSSY